MTGIKIFSGRAQHVETQTTAWIEDQKGAIEVVSISQSSSASGIALTILYKETSNGDPS